MSIEGGIEKNSGVSIEYTYKGKYDEILSSGVINDFDLKVPEGTTEFDGYIKTSYDNFAYQGSIDGAKELIAQIKRLEKLTVELQNIENQLFVAKSEKNPTLIEDLNKMKESILKELNSLEAIINPYKI